MSFLTGYLSACSRVLWYRTWTAALSPLCIVLCAHLGLQFLLWEFCVLWWGPTYPLRARSRRRPSSRGSFHRCRPSPREPAEGPRSSSRWLLQPFAFITALVSSQGSQLPDRENRGHFWFNLSTGFCLTDLWSRIIIKLYCGSFSYFKDFQLGTQKDYFGLNFWEAHVLLLFVFLQHSEVFKFMF